MALVQRQTVVDGGQGHPVPDERPVTDADPALILETAAGIDKDTAADAYIFAEVGIKRREQTKRLIHGATRDPPHDLPDLIRRMEGTVQLRGQAHGLVRISVHAVKGFRARDQRLSRIQVFQQSVQRHHGSFFSFMTKIRLTAAARPDGGRLLFPEEIAKGIYPVKYLYQMAIHAF